jgi:hypothetical protein
MWCFKLAVTVVVFALALAARDRCAAAAERAPTTTVPKTAVAPRPTATIVSPLIPLGTDVDPPPPSRDIRKLRPSVPGPDGTSVWGASLALPFQPRAPKLKNGKPSLALRPTPEIEIGVRSFGKNMGGSVQYVTRSGVRFGPGLYFNKIAPGMPAARQAMIVLQIPLPF